MASKGGRGAARRRALALTAAGLLVLALLFFVLDQPIASWISSTRTPWLTSFFNGVSQLRGISFFSLAGAAVLGVGAIFGADGLKRAGTTMVVAVLVSGLAVLALKPIVARPGPEGWGDRTDESWFGLRWGRFPSGHTAAAFSAAAGLASVYPATAPIGYALGGVVAYERIYRKVHYPSDCLAGAWLGVLAARWAARRCGGGTKGRK